MKRVILLSVSILLISLAYSFAEVPCKINYQGRLIKDNVPVDGTKTMVFSIYPDAVGDSPIWTSGNVSVEVHNGLFRYVIGSDGGDLSSIDWTAGQALCLQVIVDGETLTPREELSAYPYAINTHLLEGETKEYFLNTSVDTQTKQGNLNIMGNVGIGTMSPDVPLHVYGDGTYSAGFMNGNVGIGTTSPGAKLDVNGAILGFGIIPIGSIIAWHKSFANTPSLPDGWVECNGQILNDSDSPYNGQTIPNLNSASGYNGGRFLRGGATSGTMQDATAAHLGYSTATSVWVNNHVINSDGSAGDAGPAARHAGADGTSDQRSYMRPVNMSIVWIMRVK